MTAPKGNKFAVRHGASGLERRLETGLPLRADELAEKKEIQREMGYDVLPAGPLGLAIDLISDNVLLARRFQAARIWAAERGDREAYERLGQRSGWRNDKAINQLMDLAKAQGKNDDTVILDAITNAKSGGENSQ
jgi:hypothetical protein